MNERVVLREHVSLDGPGDSAHVYLVARRHAGMTIEQWENYSMSGITRASRSLLLLFTFSYFLVLLDANF